MKPLKRYEVLSDAALVELLQVADHSAFCEIYNRYCNSMLVYAYKKIKDEDLAKDLVQELFTNLWYRREQLIAQDNLVPFLYTALKNLIINYFIHQGVQSKYVTSIKNYINDNPVADTDHRIRESVLQLHIDKEVSLLPKKMRHVFQLSRKEQLSYREIAKRLNTSEGNVSKHITSAVKILRIKLSTLLTVLF
jgi:RNA polymerase sigma-70 factor (family 1)